MLAYSPLRGTRFCLIFRLVILLQNWLHTNQKLPNLPQNFYFFLHNFIAICTIQNCLGLNVSFILVPDVVYGMNGFSSFCDFILIEYF